jgi:uncharacterized membrane protein SpoIIM required for sporulation
MMFEDFISKRSICYVSLLTLVFLLALSLNFLYSAQNSTTNQMSKTELERRYTNYVDEKIPNINKKFLNIFLNNLRVSLFIIFPAFLILGLVIIDKNIFELSNFLLQVVLFVTFFVVIGVNTFSNFYQFFAEYPLIIVVASYLPHGIIEILAFVLSGTMVLVFRDMFKQLIIDNPSTQEPKVIFLSIIRKLIPCIVLIICLIAIAAFIETQITPICVKSAFENSLNS